MVIYELGTPINITWFKEEMVLRSYVNKFLGDNLSKFKYNFKTKYNKGLYIFISLTIAYSYQLEELCTKFKSSVGKLNRDNSLCLRKPKWGFVAKYRLF